MPDQAIIPGVPTKIAVDGQWLSHPVADVEPPEPTASPRDLVGSEKPGALGLLALGIVVAGADILFWDQHVGLSLALFAVLLYAVALLLRPVPLSGQKYAMIALGLSVLPVVEYVQTLSVLILIFGTVAALVLCHAEPVHAWGRSTLRLLLRIPYGGVFDLVRWTLTAHPAVRSVDRSTLERLLRGWALPVGGCLAFGALMLEANPVLERLVHWEPDITLPISRILFWTWIGFMCWPVIAPMRAMVPRPVERATWQMPSFGANAASTGRALVLFNLLIAVQTVLDLSILLGGAALPEGMTYATYAHRGAYPLLCTAILAGAFAIVARPYLAERRGLRMLMMIWLAQNIVLCLSALLRLDLYVGVYGLTYLRFWAAVWMVLVAIGLVLIGWQVWRERSTRWLTLRGVFVGGVTLYAACFVNVAGLIVAQNLTMSGDIDWRYLCRLPRTAHAEILRRAPDHPDFVDDGYDMITCRMHGPRIRNWRDWGFREARVIRTLAHIQMEAAVDENPRR